MLLDDLQAAYSGAPNTNLSAYKEAQKALKCHEEMTFSDERSILFFHRNSARNRSRSTSGKFALRRNGHISQYQASYVPLGTKDLASASLANFLHEL